MNLQFRSMFQTVYSSIFIAVSFSIANAQWNPTCGPWGGSVHQFTAIDSTLFASVFPNSLYRSTNNGDSWTLTEWNDASSIKVFAHQGDTMFAGTMGGTLYQSIDHGTNWTPFDTAMPSTGEITALAVNDQFIFVGSYHGIYRVSLKNHIWTEANTGLHDSLRTNNINCLAVKDSILIAGTGDGTYRSVDNGMTWKLVKSAMSTLYISSIVAMYNKLIASSSSNGLLTSADSGKTWHTVTLQPPHDANGYRLVIAQTALFAVGDSGLFISKDTGSSWSKIPGAPQPSNAMIRNYTTGSIFCSSSERIFRTDDTGRTWNEKYNGISNLTINALYPVVNSLIAATPWGTIYLTKDKGQTWTRTYDDHKAGGIHSFWTLKQTLYASCDGYGLLQSNDSGMHWSKGPEQLRDIRPNPTSGIRPINDIKEAGGWLYAATTAGVFRSRGMDSIWTQIDTNIGIQTILINDQTVFKASQLSGIGKSNISHPNEWIPYNQGLENSNVHSFFSIGNDMLVLLYNNHLYKRSFNDTNWHFLPMHRSLAIVLGTLCQQNNALFLLSEQGVLFSNTGEGLWDDISEGLPNCRSAAICSAGDEFYLGTDFHGVWTRPVRQIIPAKASSLVTTNCLHRDIDLKVTCNGLLLSKPTATPVTIRIVDLTGRVSSVISTNTLSGTTQLLNWNTLPMAHGTYCIEVRNGTTSLLRRLLVR